MKWSVSSLTMNIELIKSMLKNRRWSQADLAREIGVSPQVLSWWMTRAGMIRLDHLRQIAKALEVEAVELMQ